MADDHDVLRFLTTTYSRSPHVVSSDEDTFLVPEAAWSLLLSTERTSFGVPISLVLVQTLLISHFSYLWEVSHYVVLQSMQCWCQPYLLRFQILVLLISVLFLALILLDSSAMRLCFLICSGSQIGDAPKLKDEEIAKAQDMYNQFSDNLAKQKEQYAKEHPEAMHDEDVFMAHQSPFDRSVLQILDGIQEIREMTKWEDAHSSCIPMHVEPTQQSFPFVYKFFVYACQHCVFSCVSFSDKDCLLCRWHNQWPIMISLWSCIPDIFLPQYFQEFTLCSQH